MATLSYYGDVGSKRWTTHIITKLFVLINMWQGQYDEYSYDEYTYDVYEE